MPEHNRFEGEECFRGVRVKEVAVEVRIEINGDLQFVWLRSAYQHVACR